MLVALVLALIFGAALAAPAQMNVAFYDYSNGGCTPLSNSFAAQSYMSETCYNFNVHTSNTFNCSSVRDCYISASNYSQFYSCNLGYDIRSPVSTVHSVRYTPDSNLVEVYNCADCTGCTPSTNTFNQFSGCIPSNQFGPTTCFYGLNRVFQPVPAGATTEDFYFFDSTVNNTCGSVADSVKTINYVYGQCYDFFEADSNSLFSCATSRSCVKNSAVINFSDYSTCIGNSSTVHSQKVSIVNNTHASVQTWYSQGCVGTVNTTEVDLRTRFTNCQFAIEGCMTVRGASSISPASSVHSDLASYLF